MKINWHLVGILPLVFGILSYIIAITHSVSLWGLLWACPLIAVVGGIVILFMPRNRFAVSAVAGWILVGPLLVALFETKQNLQLQQFHHIASAVAFFVILYHWKEIWNTKGFLFGMIGFYAFTIITVNLSGGAVNLLEPMKIQGPPSMRVGIIFVMIAVAIFLWHKFSSRHAKSGG